MVPKPSQVPTVLLEFIIVTPWSIKKYDKSSIPDIAIKATELNQA
jgi:hypothetical protein